MALSRSSITPNHKTTKNPAEFIHRIFVEKSAVSLHYTQEILNRVTNIPIEIITDNTMAGHAVGPYPSNLTQGKHNLLLCKNQGKFLKPCPGTKEYQCCDYQVLNIGMNCPMDCVYCILQAYLNNPWLSFFVNTDDLLTELDQAFQKAPDKFFRIGTGEFTDSMALDTLTGLSPVLIEYMRDKSCAVLELKSKAAVINHLKNLNHNGRTIMAWSLNTPQIMAEEEFKTATLNERLTAAAQCSEWGYKLAFHFDPVIYHPNWQQGYTETIIRLFTMIDKKQIVWISMGGLRFLPQLKNIAAQRFPNSTFFSEEFIIGLDGKPRYFKTLRVEMYQLLLKQLYRYAAPETCIYLCMESDEVWQQVFGYTPAERGGIGAMLDKAAQS